MRPDRLLSACAVVQPAHEADLTASLPAKGTSTAKACWSQQTLNRKVETMFNTKGFALLAAIVVMVAVAIYLLSTREGVASEGTAIPTERTD